LAGPDPGGAADERPPAAGFRSADPGESERRQPGLEDLERLLVIAGELRALVPAELDDRMADAVHELLLASRAVIDWLLERRERTDTEPDEPRDIPIL